MGSTVGPRTSAELRADDHQCCMPFLLSPWPQHRTGRGIKPHAELLCEMGKEGREGGLLTSSSLWCWRRALSLRCTLLLDFFSASLACSSASLAAAAAPAAVFFFSPICMRVRTDQYLYCNGWLITARIPRCISQLPWLPMLEQLLSPAR